LATVLAPNPSVFTGSGTNTYVAGAGDRVVIIDPGSEDARHLAAVAEVAAGMGHVSAVVLTHHHPDHKDGAAELAARLDAPLLAFPHEDAPPLDRELVDGDTLDTGAGSLRVVHTPGHSRDHVCLHWQEAGVVFAGDLVAGEGFIVIDPPDGNMRAYLDSLARIRDLEPEQVLPGHGPAIDHPRAYLDGYIAHRLGREAKVLGALSADEPRRLAAILPEAYDDTDTAMYPVATRSLLAHLEKLVEDGTVAQEGDGEDALYRVR
jgi:glyoxylase-like metal-dependent hydrolase (beta-lactamase superfamily II)